MSETAGKQIPESHKTALEPYIATGETVQDVLALGSKTWGLADVRLLSIQQGTTGRFERARRELETIPLDHTTVTVGCTP